jgi:ABC-type Na+ efflux pump permease subunit
VPHLAARLENAGFEVVQGPEAARRSRRLIVPPGFTATVESGKQAMLEFRHTAEGQSGNYESIRVQRAAYSTLADLAILTIEGTPLTPQSLEARRNEKTNLTLKTEIATRQQRPAAGYDQSVPGMMVMFSLLVMVTTGSIHLLTERREGILRRLASSPMPRGAVVLAKWLSRFTLGVIQAAFAALTSTLWLGVHWGDHPLAVATVLLLYTAFASVAGLLLGNFAQSEGQAAGIGVASANALAALGGCMWPIEITPQWAQSLALVLPNGWAMHGLHRLMLFGDGPSAVVPHAAALAALTLACAAVLARRFRFQ